MVKITHKINPHQMDRPVSSGILAEAGTTGRYSSPPCSGSYAFCGRVLVSREAVGMVFLSLNSPLPAKPNKCADHRNECGKTTPVRSRKVFDALLENNAQSRPGGFDCALFSSRASKTFLDLTGVVFPHSFL